MNTLFDKLASLLGRRIDDADLLAFLSKIGCKAPKSTTDNDSTSYLHAKKQGLEFAFSHIVHDRAKYPPRKEHRRYVTYFTCAWLRDAFPEPLPGGLGLARTRADLVKRYGAPIWLMYGDGDAPVRERFVVKETRAWTLTCEWNAPDGVVDGIHVAMNEARDLGSADLATGLFAAWTALRFGLAERHAKSAVAKKLLARKISGTAFLREACDGHLWSDDLAPAIEEFAFRYCQSVLDESESWAKATRTKDSVGLGLDFEETFADWAPDFDQIPDTWATFDRLAPCLDARWADYQLTHFRSPPPPKLYADAKAKQLAAKKKAGKVVVPAPESAAAPSALTERLLGLIGKPSTDPAVVALSNELGLRLPKKHEDIPDPKRGFWIDYHKEPGKKSFAVRGITFLPEGRHNVRFEGELRFAPYAAGMPKGLSFADSRGALAKKLGKPADSDEDSMEWRLAKEKRRIIVWFEGKKIASICWLDSARIR